MRLFADENVFGSPVWEAIHDGTAWGSWKKLVSGGISTYQPSAMEVGGEIQLVTRWFMSTLDEQGLE